MQLNDLLQMGRKDPKAAHSLVSEMVGKRGGFDAFFKFKGRQECVKKAMAKPLPGESADAFLRGAINVGDKHVYEIVPTHMLVLQAIESPILKAFEEATSKSDKTATGEMNDERRSMMLQFLAVTSSRCPTRKSSSCLTNGVILGMSAVPISMPASWMAALNLATS